ncbi:hypothetical protein QNI16_14775 [Cytophagaceae bacterium YF14B1]|uniref:Lipoprotein n=1 Tax=Xanthocytophaga flava TaxID=3048013 RepID=A0AAE3QLX9_9BACT|nr:hypothetical protein [Xanthocytophaga flavus]MDJ1481762.1 hypothetical protein [Xanthocytophaga flavus]
MNLVKEDSKIIGERSMKFNIFILVFCLGFLACRNFTLHIESNRKKKQLFLVKQRNVIDSVPYQSHEYTKYKILNGYLYYTDKVNQLSRIMIRIYKADINQGKIKLVSQKNILQFDLDNEVVSKINFREQYLYIETKDHSGRIKRKNKYMLLEF